MALRSPTPAAGSGDEFFPTFAFIWGVSTLIHQISLLFWLGTWQGWLLTFAAMLVVLEPRCALRFGSMVALSLLNLWEKLPFVPNHILFEGFLNLTILIALIWGAWNERAFSSWRRLRREIWRRFGPFLISGAVKAIFLLSVAPPRNPVWGGLTSLALVVTLGFALNRKAIPAMGESAYHLSAPILRVAVVIMYFWAFIQKLNWDYLNPETSCAASLYARIAGYFGFPTDTWALYGAIGGSLLLEVGIPILLIWPRFRFWGFIAAIIFHLWLSIHPAAGIFSYSALILACLYLFLPTAAMREMRGIWSRQVTAIGAIKRIGPILRRIGVTKLAGWAILTLFVLGTAMETILFYKHGKSAETLEFANRIGFWLWMAWGVWLGAGYVSGMYRVRDQSLTLPNWPAPTPAWMGVALVALNGLCPWIGLKTQTSYSMYSNLRTEGSGNHLFLRRANWFPYQDDMVEIVSSEPDVLTSGGKPRGIQHFANPGMVMPYLELRRVVSEREGNFRIVYQRDGKDQPPVQRFGGVEDGDAYLFQPLPWYEYKLLWFRRHESLAGPMHCTH